MKYNHCIPSNKVNRSNKVKKSVGKKKENSGIDTVEVCFNERFLYNWKDEKDLVSLNEKNNRKISDKNIIVNKPWDTKKMETDDNKNITRKCRQLIIKM